MYPYLSELLAREWIVIVPGVDGEPSPAPETHRRFRAALDKVESDHDEVAKKKLPEPIRIVESTRLWYQFFQNLGRLGLYENGVHYYFAATSAGRQALKDYLA
jgi:hypothetical protein